MQHFTGKLQIHFSGCYWHANFRESHLLSPCLQQIEINATWKFWLKAKSRQITKVNIFKCTLFWKGSIYIYMYVHYIKLLSFLNPSGSSPCRKCNYAKSMNQKSHLFDHCIIDVCMMKWLKYMLQLLQKCFVQSLPVQGLPVRKDAA